MNSRTLAFYALAMTVVLGASYYQNLYHPAVPPEALANAPDSIQIEEETDVGSELENRSLANNEDNQHETPDETTGQTDSVDAGSATIEADVEAESKDDLQTVSKLYTVGSISSESLSRYLITFDGAGGTVRRVELNFRDKKGRLKYRDLEYSGGYLGELDCIDTVEGCQVRVVGDGTPARIAGVQPGDIIKAVDGEPVIAVEDFLDLLADSKPGKSISLTVLTAKGRESTFDISLTDKPIEVIRPEPDVLEEGNFGNPSFRTTLRLPSQTKVTWGELDPQMMGGAWQLERLTKNEIEFSFTITEQQLAKSSLGVNGPVKVTKIYSLPDIGGNSTEKGERDFHFEMKLSIVNLGKEQQEICYQLDGPLGTPSETWWYQNKIHGRDWAIGYVAGARDVVGSTGQEEFTFFGGPEIVTNLSKTEPKYFWVLKPPTETDSSSQEISYLGVDTQYFNVSLIPKNGDERFSAYSVMADAAIVEIPKNTREKKLVDCTFRMFKVLTLQPNEPYQQNFEIFAGPKEPEILATYALDDVRSFGWFAMFSKPLCWLLRFFYNLTFQLGYGIPIILLTVLVRSLMIPISRKAALNAQMMQYLQPQMKELADKYKDDMEKRGQAQRDLFKKYKYNPFGGCLMAFFQIPIFIGLYRGLSVDIALRDQPLIRGLSWCSNLSAPDQLWYWKDTLPGFLNFLTNESGWLGPYLNVLPIITCLLFVVQQKMFTPPPTDEQQEMMQKVMKYMMVFMGFLFFKVPAGLCLYFITSSLWGIIERKMLPKPELDKSKLDDLPDVSNSKAAQQKTAKQDAREEKAQRQRQSEQEEKKRRDKERRKKLKRRDDGRAVQ